MMLNSLPPEIVLYIFSYLPVSALSQLYSVSRTWNAFLLQHETTIFRQAAFLHGFIDDDSASLDSMELIKKYSERILTDVDNWKTLCKIRVQVRNAWNGAAPSKIGIVSAKSRYFTSLTTTHRIKVDEKRGLIMTTTRLDMPRVHVCDMNTGTMLWWLEPTEGRIYAHLEYSEGFLIFDRATGDREVWRLTDSTLDDTVHAVPCSETPVDFDESSRPDSIMLRDSQIALRIALSRLDFEPPEGFRPRGCFEPYALLHDLEETRAYRFVYPTLLTAARDKVYLWDIPSARVVEVVQGIQRATVSEQSSKVPKVDSFFDAHENLDAEAQDQEDPNMSDQNMELYHPEQERLEEEGLMQGGMPSHIASDNGEQDDHDDEDSEEDSDDSEEDSDPESEEDDDDDDEEGDVRPYHVPRDLTLLRLIRYVDHSPTHIFLAGQYVLKIFCRASTTGDGGFEIGAGANSNASHQLALALTSTKFRYGRWKYTIRPGSGRQAEGSCLVRYDLDVHDGENANRTEKLYDQFKAVHVSPCGSHFVALLGGARILIVPHFRTLVGQSEEVIYNAILDVQLSSPDSTSSVYLAYEEGDGGEGRVGVVTTGAVFIVTLPQFPLNKRTNTSPLLHISRVKWLYEERLKHVSCLMLSDTRLFVNYDSVFWNIPQRDQQDWEESFELGLRNWQTFGYDCYRFSEQALFVKGLRHSSSNRPFDSTVHEVDMLPS